jgi:NAD(P)-dependent dehydrogenase (short-subunit alcohol dehydrogenase family)
VTTSLTAQPPGSLYVMIISFENKVALVTGAASGLGLATAKAFAESGASVAMADWSEEAVSAAAGQLASHGHKTLAIRCDVSDDAQVEAMVARTVAHFGRLDAAYNNAGVQNLLAEKQPTKPRKTLTASPESITGASGAA